MLYLQSAFASAPNVQWKIGDMVAGQVRSGGGLTFAAVEGAGHMVPMDQPEAVRTLSTVYANSCWHSQVSACFSLHFYIYGPIVLV